MKVAIIVNVEDEDCMDTGHHTGITSDAYERLTSYTEEHGAGALTWLGEVQDVTKVSD